MSQEEFEKMMREKFPGDPKDPNCFEFPGLGKDFFEKWWKDLYKLLKQLPSILFRGLANAVDPAYKEMRSHYLNCDIKNLTYSGLTYNSVDKELVNGLKFPSRLPDCTDPVRSERGPHGRKIGKYAPLIPTAIPADIIRSFANPFLIGTRLAKTSLKMVTYIYNGNAPFIDPSSVFKLPCAKWPNKDYYKGEKWDAGAYGRYGHPLTPITLLALATPELKSDRDKQKGTCQDIPEDC